MIGLFLRGAAAAPVVDDTSFKRPNLPDDTGYDRDNDFWSGMSDAFNLDVFDEESVSIKYDGFLALARHAYHKVDNSPLEFLSNVALDVLKIKMGELGFDVRQEPVAPAPPEATIADIVLAKTKITLSRFVIEDTDIRFRNVFFSAEAWVHGGADVPFRGVTEEGTCPRYRPLLFYNGLSESEAAYVERESHIGHRTMEIDIGPENGPERSLVDNIIDNKGSVNHSKMYFLREKFKEWNQLDPSTLTRGGGLGLVGNSFREELKALTTSRAQREYYHTDTDPILTIALMMFTSFTCQVGEDIRINVDIDDHGYSPSTSKSYNVVPPDMKIEIGLPGYSIYHASCKYLNCDNDGWFDYSKSKVNATNEIRDIPTGHSYRDIHLGPNGFINIVPYETFHIYSVFWSTRLMNAVFDLMYPGKSSTRTLGQYARVVKEGLFWFSKHRLRAFSCQSHYAANLVQRAFNVFWLNFERGLFATLQQREGGETGTKLVDGRKMISRDGLFASLTTVEAIQELLIKIFEEYMPPAFKIPIDSQGGVIPRDAFAGLDLSNGVRFSDLTAIVTNYFLTTHLDIDIQKSFSAILSERKSAKTVPKTTHGMYNSPGTQEVSSLGASVSRIIAGMKLSDAVQKHRKPDDTPTDPDFYKPRARSYKNPTFTMAELYEAVVAVLGLHRYAYLYRDGMPKEKSLAELEEERLGKEGSAQIAGASPASARYARFANRSPGNSSALAAITASLAVVAASAFAGALQR